MRRYADFAAEYAVRPALRLLEGASQPDLKKGQALRLAPFCWCATPVGAVVYSDMPGFGIGECLLPEHALNNRLDKLVVELLPAG